MSIQNDQINQMYKVISALTAVALEAHGGQTEETQKLEYELDMLTDIMTPYVTTADEVRALRTLTGDGMSRCYNAIVMARGDQELAVSLMQGGRV